MSTPETKPETMAGKPVLYFPTKRVINMKSGFEEKLLCDGPTFSTGDACVYDCAFCYVSNQMRFQAAARGYVHTDVVVRRKDALAFMVDQLMHKGRPKYSDPADNRVIYSSPLVDVAANMKLCRETVEACLLILRMTNWHIRLLSKSNLLPKIAEMLCEEAECEPSSCIYQELSADEVRARLIFGVSTGTLDDGVAAAFERGTAKVSKRIESLHWLQDNGFRTYGMICPSLPRITGEWYHVKAMEFAKALRIEKLEHVWAEVINVRGDSLTATADGLRNAGHVEQALDLIEVSRSAEAWEHYAQETFNGYINAGYTPDKLRFLQYVDEKNFHFWKHQEASGAVLLGKDKMLARMAAREQKGKA